MQAVATQNQDTNTASPPKAGQDTKPTAPPNVGNKNEIADAWLENATLDAGRSNFYFRALLPLNLLQSATRRVVAQIRQQNRTTLATPPLKSGAPGALLLSRR
jgi:hypothetical protein